MKSGMMGKRESHTGGGSIGVDMKIHFGFCRWLFEFDNQIRVVCK